MRKIDRAKTGEFDRDLGFNFRKIIGLILAERSSGKTYFPNYEIFDNVVQATSPRKK